jgi:hypothetical protein
MASMWRVQTRSRMFSFSASRYAATASSSSSLSAPLSRSPSLKSASHNQEGLKMYPATSKGPGAASTASEARNTFSLQKEPEKCSAFRLVMQAPSVLALVIIWVLA